MHGHKTLQSTFILAIITLLVAGCSSQRSPTSPTIQASPILTIPSIPPTPVPTIPSIPPTPLPTLTLNELDDSMNTIDVFTRDGTDDAGPNPERNCEYSTAWSEIYLGKCPNGSAIINGFRFPEIALVQNANVGRVDLDFSRDPRDAPGVSLNLTIYGEATGDAQPFSESNRPDNRPLTNARAEWSIKTSNSWAPGSVSGDTPAPDLRQIVLEIINRPDWKPGNAIAIIIKSTSSVIGSRVYRRIFSHDITYAVSGKGYYTVPVLEILMAKKNEP